MKRQTMYSDTIALKILGYRENKVYKDTYYNLLGKLIEMEKESLVLH